MIRFLVFGILALVGLGLVIGALWKLDRRQSAEWRQEQSTGMPLPEITTATFPVEIHKPENPPRVAISLPDSQEARAVACSICHSVREPQLEVAHAEELDAFHQGLKFAHGELTCLSCHNARDYDTLKLAGGAAIPYREVMTLCGQCHGTQMRDYKRGSHGGMAGYWDLTRGPRVRNNCIDCHDPHAPAFPLVMPVFPPRDHSLGAPRGAPSKPGMTMPNP